MKGFAEYLEEKTNRKTLTAKKLYNALDKKFGLHGAKKTKKRNAEVTSVKSTAIRGDVIDEIEKMGGSKMRDSERPGWETFHVNDELLVQVNKKMVQDAESDSPVTRIDIAKELS